MDRDCLWIGFTRGDEMVHLDVYANKGKLVMRIRDERSKVKH
jgi:hypothetical protein